MAADQADPSLTRAEARALLRSAPLTHSQLMQHLSRHPGPAARAV